MDMRLDEEQRMTLDAFTDFFANECPSTLIRELETGSGHSPEIWRKLAAMDGMALNLPEAYDGLEGTFIDMALVYEAMGRSLYPSPHLWTVVVAAELILRLGNIVQKANLLPKIAAGEAILALAMAEKDTDDPAAVQTTVISQAEATSEGNGFYLNGRKRFVEFAHLADDLLVVARTEQGVTLFLVPTDREGIVLTRQSDLGGGQFYGVDFKNVTVAAGEVLGQVGGGLAPLNAALDRARVALAARMLGGCQAVFDLTLRYTKEREQFGQRIATFQHIAFRLAEMHTRIDGARLLLYQTAWQIDQARPIATQAAMLKALVSDLYRHVTDEAVQIHGGFGFIEEADPQLYYRRAAVDAVLLGTATTLRDRLANNLGLNHPRETERAHPARPPTRRNTLTNQPRGNGPRASCAPPNFPQPRRNGTRASCAPPKPGGTLGQTLYPPQHRHHRHLFPARQPGPGRAAEPERARLPGQGLPRRTRRRRM
jgi:alkylation response protein AidB-like acyl-CoA dehydrogenase